MKSIEVEHVRHINTFTDETKQHRTEHEQLVEQVHHLKNKVKDKTQHRVNRIINNFTGNFTIFRRQFHIFLDANLTF